MATQRLSQAIDAYHRADDGVAAALVKRLAAEEDERAAQRAYDDAKAELLAANREAFGS